MQISDVSTQLKLEPGMGGDRRQLLASLRTGQVLQAVAMSANTGGRVSLRIGNTEVQAQTGLQTNAGQRLSLVVIKAGALPELSLLQSPTSTGLQAAALRSALPRQVPLDLVLNALTRVGDQPVIAQFPQLQEAIRRLFAGLPSTLGLKSDQPLSRVFGESGLLMESHLSKGSLSSRDLKANLLRLLVQLNTALNLPVDKKTDGAKGPPGSLQSNVPHGVQQVSSAPLQTSLLRELAVQTEGALARIQLNQLTSVPAGEREAQLWQFDLPLRHDDYTDVFGVRITREDSPEKAADTPLWTLTLRFNLSPLGPIEVRLSLTEATLSTHFWAERADTRARIEREIPQLEQAFVRSGLSAARFTVHQGAPPETPPATQGFRLLDVKA